MRFGRGKLRPMVWPSWGRRRHGGVAALLVLAIVSALSSCTGSDRDSTTTTSLPSLDDRQFVSTSIVGDDVADDKHVTIGFDNDTLSAVLDCNRLMASYRLDGERLLTEHISITAGGCGKGSGSHDVWLFKFLESQPRAHARPRAARTLDRHVSHPLHRTAGGNDATNKHIAADRSPGPAGCDRALWADEAAPECTSRPSASRWPWGV